MKRAVIFDGDDTLWLTEPLYDRARAAARKIVERAGFDGARWEELEREIDVHNVATFGHSPQRFPQSCVDALDALAQESAGSVTAGIRDEVRRAGGRVFSDRAPLRAHARKVLRELKSRGLKLGLLTKGDRAVQVSRIDGSGLASFFDVI